MCAQFIYSQQHNFYFIPFLIGKKCHIWKLKVILLCKRYHNKDKKIVCKVCVVIEFVFVRVDKAKEGRLILFWKKYLNIFLEWNSIARHFKNIFHVKSTKRDSNKTNWLCVRGSNKAINLLLENYSSTENVVIHQEKICIN